MPTVADHAQEKLTAIRSRLGELRTTRGSPEIATDELGPEGPALIVEERNLAAYLEAINAAVESGPRGGTCRWSGRGRRVMEAEPTAVPVAHGGGECKTANGAPSSERAEHNITA